MSRIGKKPIPLPDKVKVEIQVDHLVVTGPKGSITTHVPAGIQFQSKDKQLVAVRRDDSNQQRAFHGLARALAANAVRGVTDGFSRDLEITGVGYRAEVRGKSVIFAIGFSHPIEYPIPAGLSVAIDKQTRLTITGADKHMVGQFAANIRSLRPPDPYKQKGIRYAGEVLKKKAGKAAGGKA